MNQLTYPPGKNTGENERQRDSTSRLGPLQWRNLSLGSGRLFGVYIRLSCTFIAQPQEIEIIDWESFLQGTKRTPKRKKCNHPVPPCHAHTGWGKHSGHTLASCYVHCGACRPPPLCFAGRLLLCVLIGHGRHLYCQRVHLVWNALLRCLIPRIAAIICMTAERTGKNGKILTLCTSPPGRAGSRMP